MGLTNRSAGVSSLFKKVAYENLPEESVLIFDGLILLFSIITKETINEGVTYEEYCEKFIEKINMHSYSGSKQNIILFDGKSPKMKSFTQQQRTHTPIDVEKFRTMLQMNVDNFYIPTIIKKLLVGESEMEAVKQKFTDDNLPRVVVTNDTDMYHIMYGEPDVYFTTTFYRTICCSHVQEIPIMAFKTLIFIAGTDYSQQIISKTMLENAISLYRETKIKLPTFCKFTPFNVKVLIKYWIVLSNKKTATLSRKISSEKNFDKYLENIMWCIEYSNFGCSYSKYNDINIKYTQIDTEYCYRYLFQLSEDKKTLKCEIAKQKLKSLVDLLT